MSRKQSSTKRTTHFEFRGRILCLLTRVQRRESLVFSAEIFQARAVLFGFSSFREKSSQIVTSRYKFPRILPTTTHSDCEVFHAHHTNALDSLEFRALFSPSLRLVLFVERVLRRASSKKREFYTLKREGDRSLGRRKNSRESRAKVFCSFSCPRDDLKSLQRINRYESRLCASEIDTVRNVVFVRRD